MTEATRAVTFTIDGRQLTGEPGETVLSVAGRNGIHIPTLCHHEAVQPYGACRLCIVEVAWGKRSKIVTSCIYQPYENDAVTTNNERVRRARTMVLEMLLARCPEAEAVRTLAAEYGVRKPRFAQAKVPGPKGCILCGLCVRVCDEVVGQRAIGYASRGIDRYVTTPYGEPSDECIGCLACVHVCPARALHYEDAGGVRMMKEFNTSIPLVKCTVCGRFFATTRQVDYVMKKCKIPEEATETCPQCRAVSFALEALAVPGAPSLRERQSCQE